MKKNSKWKINNKISKHNQAKNIKLGGLIFSTMKLEETPYELKLRKFVMKIIKIKRKWEKKFQRQSSNKHKLSQ
jgi:hypothetical protein